MHLSSVIAENGLRCLYLNRVLVFVLPKLRPLYELIIATESMSSWKKRCTRSLCRCTVSKRLGTGQKVSWIMGHIRSRDKGSERRTLPAFYRERVLLSLSCLPSISYPESSGSLARGWSLGETDGEFEKI